jgi:hypothetical protein
VNIEVKREKNMTGTSSLEQVSQENIISGKPEVSAGIALSHVVVEMKLIPTIVLNSNQSIALTPGSLNRDSIGDETHVIIHEQKGNELRHGHNEYLRSSGIVHRAMRMLEEWKYVPARISNSLIPVDIIAMRKSEALLIQVISSKKPVPDAKTLVRLYAEKVNYLRMMGTSQQFRKYIMVYSLLSGWKYYEVLPGGLIPAWHLTDLPEE